MTPYEEAVQAMATALADMADTLPVSEMDLIDARIVLAALVASPDVRAALVAAVEARAADLVGGGSSLWTDAVLAALTPPK